MYHMYVVLRASDKLASRRALTSARPCCKAWVPCVSMPTKAKQPAKQASAESGVKKSHKKKPTAERIAPKPKPAHSEGNSAASADPVLKPCYAGAFSQRQSMP